MTEAFILDVMRPLIGSIIPVRSRWPTPEEIASDLLLLLPKRFREKPDGTLTTHARYMAAAIARAIQRERTCREKSSSPTTCESARPGGVASTT